MVRIEQNDTEATPVEESETMLWTGVQFPPSPLQRCPGIFDIPLSKAHQKWWVFHSPDEATPVVLVNNELKVNGSKTCGMLKYETNAFG